MWNPFRRLTVNARLWTEHFSGDLPEIATFFQRYRVLPRVGDSVTVSGWVLIGGDDGEGYRDLRINLHALAKVGYVTFSPEQKELSIGLQVSETELGDLRTYSDNVREYIPTAIRR